MALFGGWGTMFASPEYDLRSRSIEAQREASGRQMAVAKAQMALQREAFEERKVATKAGQSSLERMVEQYNQAYGSAKVTGEQRYQEMLGITDASATARAGKYREMLGSADRAAIGQSGRYDEMLRLAGQTTQQRATDIRADYTEQEASGLQRLARQGMAGTTVAPTMAMGYQREQQSALNRLADQMQGTQLGIMGQRASGEQYQQAQRLGILGRQAEDTRRTDKLGIMERRTDEYPNANILLALASALGQGGGTSGGLTNMAGALSGMRVN